MRCPFEVALIAACFVPLPLSRANDDKSFEEFAFSVVFSPDGKTLATGSYDRIVHLWDVATGKRKLTLPAHSGQVGLIAFSPDGKCLATNDGDSVRLWDSATGKERHARLVHKSPVHCLAFSPDRRTLATGSGTIREEDSKMLDCHVRLWDLTTSKERRVLRGHSSMVIDIAFSPDGKTFASADRFSERILLWDAASGRRQGQLRNATLLSDCWALADGFWDASRAEERLLFIAEIIRRLIIGEDVMIGLTDADSCTIRFSPDGRTLVAGMENGRIHLWDVAARKVRLSLDGHKGGVCAVDFSPDGKTLATSGISDGIVRLWDATTGKERLALPDRDPVFAFTPDGKSITFGGTKPIRISELSKSKTPKRCH